MRLLIRYLNGLGQDAILLASMENRIRVAIPGRDDATEFLFIEGQWISEQMDPVEIEESPEIEEYGWGGAPQFNAAALSALPAIDYGFNLVPASEPAPARAVN